MLIRHATVISIIEPKSQPRPEERPTQKLLAYHPHYANALRTHLEDVDPDKYPSLIDAIEQCLHSFFHKATNATDTQVQLAFLAAMAVAYNQPDLAKLVKRDSPSISVYLNIDDQQNVFFHNPSWLPLNFPTNHLPTPQRGACQGGPPHAVPPATP